MMKKLLALCAALCLLTCCLPAMAEETEEVTISLKPWSAENGYTYVEYGYYPTESNGALAPILWRVLNVEKNSVTMVSEYAIDVVSANRYTSPNKVRLQFANDRNLSTHENNSLLRTGLLSVEDVQNAYYGYADAQTRCVKPTPYAAGKNVDLQQGCIAYWIKQGSKVQYVSASGDVMPVSHTMKLGVVPTVTVSMNEMKLDSGSGTMEDPYYATANVRNIWLEENLYFTFGSKVDTVRRLAAGSTQIYTGPGNQYYAFSDSVLKKGKKVTILAREGSWLLVEYQTGKSRNYEFATGYIPIRAMYNANVTFDETPYLPMCRVDGVMKKDADLYDDRYMVSQPIHRLWSGNSVTVLGVVYNNSRTLAYVEAEMYDHPVRGFVDFYDLELEGYEDWMPHYSKGL